MVGRLLIAMMAALAVIAPSPVFAHTPYGGSAYTWRLFTGTHAMPLFYSAAGIAAGASGNIFVSDEGDHRVEKFSPSGRLLASWGTDNSGPLRLSGPRAVTVDAGGNVYLADDGVVKLSYTGRFLARWTAGALGTVSGLTVDASRNVYALSLHPVPFSSSFDRLIISKLSSAGRRLATFVYTYPQPTVDALLGATIAAAPSGNLLLSIRGQHHCHACDGTYYLLRTISPAGRTVAEVQEDAGGGSMAVNGAGEIFLTMDHAVEKLSPSGIRLSTFGSAGCGSDRLGSQLQITVSPLGSLYVADSQVAAFRPDTYPAAFRNGVLHRYGFDGAPLGLVGTCPVAGAGTQFGQINGLAVTPAGTAYVADGITSKVYRIAAGGALVGSIDANHPSTVSTDSRSNLYVPNIFADALEKHAPNGALLARSRIPLVEAAAIDRGGDVYALAGSGEILVLPPVGRGSTPIRHWQMVGYPPDSSGLVPEGICLDGQGNIWVADIRHNNIQEFASSGRLLRIWGHGGTGPSRFHNPTALTVDGRGHLFVVDSGNNRVQEFDLRGHFLAMYGREGQTIGQFMTPAGIGADAQGNLYIGDRGNDRIQELIRR